MRATAAVAGALVLLPGWLVGRPVLRHDGQARDVRDDLARVVAEATGARPSRLASRVGGSPPGANGGHCRYYATATVRTALSPAELRARMEAVPGREPLWWWLDESRVAEPGVLVVTAEALGEGGTLDPRCG